MILATFEANTVSAEYEAICKMVLACLTGTYMGLIATALSSIVFDT
jgi:hypothetical protein